MSDIHFPLWHGSDVVHAVQGLGPTDWQATGISIDTRTLHPGDLFIALRGPKSDGHDFIESAWALGACAVLAEDIGSISTNPQHSTVVVSDTLQALIDLAHAARARFKGHIFSVTGSVGKTTVKDGLAHILSKQGRTSASLNSLNNHFGVPLSLARLPQNAQYGVIEVGMNHAGEIAELMPIIAPHSAMITQVSYQHGEFFPDIHGIVQAKAEIFSAPGPLIGILPRDSIHYEALKNNRPHVTRWITFGQHPESDIRLVAEQPDNSRPKDAGRYITIRIKDRVWHYHWSQPGEHTLYNSLAIIAGAYAVGVCLDKVMQDLPNIQPSSGRGNTRTLGGIRIVDESYNAAPASMQAALRTFADTPIQAKRYILLGEMKELGQQSHTQHHALVPYIQACKADGVWLCGAAYQPFLQDISELRCYAPDISSLIPWILKTLQPGDDILIKGANSMRTFTLIQALEDFYKKL